MAEIWYPNAVREPCASGLWGATFSHLDKHVLHTTEGNDGGDPYMDSGSYGAAGKPYHPNYTLCVKNGRWTIAQHIPSNRGARALVTGNNLNLTQTEMAWQAHRIDQLPQEAFDVLGHLMAWEKATLGLPLAAGTQFYGEGAGWILASSSARQRMSNDAFANYRGICGHQHVPGQDHWDPGAFDVARLLRAAGGAGPVTGGVAEMPENWWPVLAKGDQTHAYWVRFASTTLNMRGWAIQPTDRNDDNFRFAIAVVQNWAQAADKSMVADGTLGPKTWPAVLGLGPFSKLKVPH